MDNETEQEVEHKYLVVRRMGRIVVTMTLWPRDEVLDGPMSKEEAEVSAVSQK